MPSNNELRIWEAEGRTLGERERSARSLMWNIGDWWNRGEAYGERAQIVTAGNWTGPAYGTCRNAGSVAALFNVSLRSDKLAFEHFKLVAPLMESEPRAAKELLEWCLEPDDPRPVNELRQELDRRRQQHKLVVMAMPAGNYPLLLADPPWRYERAPMGGANRAIENQYPTMALEDICALKVPAAANSLLYVWATAPKLGECFDVLAAWGFDYRTNMVWVKDKIGMGYYARSQHELLLIARRGEFPPPLPEQPESSVIFADRQEHSAKPEAVYELIERQYPTLPKVELFARTPRKGWAAWGNQLQEAAE